MASPTVMKFGGTSVEDAAAFERVAAIVRPRLEARPVVVVSAMSRVTDALVSAVRRAAEGKPEEAAASLDEHLERHSTVGRSLAAPEDRAELAVALEDARHTLADLLRIIAAHPGTRPALHDEVVAYGERLSSHLLAAALRGRGLPARWVDGRACVRTTADHTRAEPLPEQTRTAARAHLVPLLDAGEVPVLGGFIASALDGATTTLGRGGSDYTAALVGAALDAAEIQIWTDVTGFLTADPRVVPNAIPISRLSYAEAAELAFFGAKVLHPRTILPAVERGIAVRVCNSRQPDAGGTTIEAGSEPVERGVKAIAHKSGVTLVQVTAARMLGAYGFLRSLFEVFERHRVAVDVVATSEVSVSASLDDASALAALVPDLERLGTVEVEEGNAIVCVVGEGLRDSPGIAGDAFGAVRDVNVRLISQGASRINLTFVVDESRAREVVRRLHAAFFEGP
jgi:aspartate kinase